MCGVLSLLDLSGNAIEIGAARYELYLAVEDIDHSRSKTKSPQTRPATSFFEQKRAARGRRRKEKDAIGAASRVSLARISNP